MEDKNSNQVEESRFIITRISESVPIKTERVDGSVDLIVQRRRRDDGRFSREFLTIRIDLGNRMFYFHPEVAELVKNALTVIVPAMHEEEMRLEEEAEQRRKEWESKKSGNDSNQKTTGKTARQKAKGYDPTRRKTERSQKDKELRNQMRGR